jgi:quercetin dioxygenase-like cupin family protein
MTQQTGQEQAPKPVAVASGEGEARWWFGALAVIKATAADTGGQMTIVEITEAPAAETPLHVHHREDEGFWILEGDVTFEVGDITIKAHAGDYAFGPAPAISRTATKSAMPAAGCCSSAHPAALKTW